MQTKEPRVKGVAFRSIDLCYVELRGEAARTRARALMPPELRAANESGLILPASWYPISWYRETFRAFRAASNDGPELARLIGRASVRHDMQSIYKQMFARLVSPQLLLSFTGRLYSTYYDTGALAIVESRRGFAIARASGCLGWDGNMWTELVGACTGMLETAGAKNVRTHARSGGRDGDVDMELEAHWT